MADFVLYGLDDAGRLTLSESFSAIDVAEARRRGVERALALPSVEIWQGSVCVFRRATRLSERAVPPLRGRLAADPAAVARALAGSLAEALDVAVIATAADGMIAYWNAAATTLYGWSVDEAVGRDVMDITPALQSHATANAIMRALQAGEPWEGEITLRRRDGAPFQAYVIDTPISVSAGAADVIVGASAPAERRSLVVERNQRLRAELARLLQAA